MLPYCTSNDTDPVRTFLPKKCHEIGFKFVNTSNIPCILREGGAMYRIVSDWMMSVVFFSSSFLLFHDYSSPVPIECFCDPVVMIWIAFDEWLPSVCCLCRVGYIVPDARGWLGDAMEFADWMARICLAVHCVIGCLTRVSLCGYRM